MPFPLAVTDRIVIPESAVETRFVRASGPGGQHVNKVSSKVQMWIDLDRITGATPDEMALLRQRLQSRLDARGRLMISSQATRDQARNLEDAAMRVAELFRAALIRTKVRRPTKPTRASRERRLGEKRRISERRQDRRINEE
jgi:ribosome-associated protein